MKRAWNFLYGIAGLVLLGALALGLGAAFQVLRGSGAAGAVAGTPQGYPPPQATVPVPGSTLPPQPTLPLVGPEETFIVPTLTPWPTLTPQPTPTRRPGPTATAVPFPTPAKNASGVIRYTTGTGSPDSTYSHFVLLVDALGRIKGATASVSLPSDLGFSPSQVIPSPNGRYLLTMLPVEPGGQPYVIDQTTGEVKTPLSGFAPGQFNGWHPDGRHFLFVVDGGGPWLVDAQTSEVTQLVIDSAIQGAAISPNGLTVAYIGSNPSVTSGIGYALWLVSSAGSDAKLQFDSGSQSYLYPGAWSPDGKWIAYLGNCADPAKANPLCLFNPSTGERMALNITSFAGINTAWSPNSQHIAVTGFVRGERLCEGNELSPLEKEACQFDDGHIIYVVDTLKNEILQLTSGIAPVWSPDGSMLEFISKRSGTPEIWTIQADGTNLQQLTTDGQYKSPYNLTWSVEVGQ